MTCCRDSVVLYLKWERDEYSSADEYLRSDVQASLSSFLTFAARLMSNDPKWNGAARALDQRPGFVSVEFEGHRVDTPYFLTGDLPSEKLLLELCRVGASLKAATSSTLCLSGSACYSGSAKYFGDIDFCEYVPHNDRTLAAGLLTAALSTPTMPYMHGFRLGNLRWHRGNAADWSSLMNLLNDDREAFLSDATFRQATHVVRLIAGGVLEATNVILLVSPAAKGADESSRTFVHQELPLSTDWIPTDLSQPLELGRYVVWLVRQIATLLAASRTKPQNAIKAARRALALSRVLMQQEASAIMVKHLRHKRGGKIAALAGRCALYSALADQDKSETVEGVLRELRSTIDRIRGFTVSEDHGYRELLAKEQSALEDLATASRVALTDFLQQVQRQLGSIPPERSAGNKLALFGVLR